MLNKEALEYLVGLGYEEEVLVETEKGLFSKTRLERVEVPQIDTLEVSNLTSVIDFMKANIDGVQDKLLIQVSSPRVVPNPVILAPYRTFPEIEQVESKFIFRMQEGPNAALYEADGGAWKNEAMRRIKEYLVENLKELKARYEIIS